MGKIPLGGKPEFGVTTGAGEIFVNLEDKSEILALDPVNLKIKSTWPLAPCESPSGLAIDVKNRRLFAGCDNKMMAVVNADTGKVITTLPIGDGVDANGFDPDLGFAYASCGEGVLVVAHEDSPDTFSVVQNRAHAAWRAHHDRGQQDAPDLPGDGEIRPAAGADRPAAASPARDVAGFVYGAGGREINHRVIGSSGHRVI